MKLLQECLEERRSVRSFENRPVERSVLRQLVQNACMAPTGSNIQPWQYLVIDEPELVQELTSFIPGIGSCPPCLVVLCADHKRALEKGGVMGRDQLSILDVAMAAENLILSAVDHDLGSCAIRSFSAPILQKLLKLPGHIVPELIITLGYPAGSTPAPPKRPLCELLYFNGWGERYAEAMD